MRGPWEAGSENLASHSESNGMGRVKSGRMVGRIVRSDYDTYLGIYGSGHRLEAHLSLLTVTLLLSCGPTRFCAARLPSANTPHRAKSKHFIRIPRLMGNELRYFAKSGAASIWRESARSMTFAYPEPDPRTSPSRPSITAMPLGTYNVRSLNVRSLSSVLRGMNCGDGVRVSSEH
jgi:hypothetical protein